MMPIYDFQCSHCGDQGAMAVRLSDANMTIYAARKKKIFSQILFVFSCQLSGASWLITDFKSSEKLTKIAKRLINQRRVLHLAAMG